MELAMERYVKIFFGAILKNVVVDNLGSKR